MKVAIELIIKLCEPVDQRAVTDRVCFQKLFASDMQVIDGDLIAYRTDTIDEGLIAQKVVKNLSLNTQYIQLKPLLIRDKTIFRRMSQELQNDDWSIVEQKASMTC